jgi:hypothetical protein
MQRRCEYNNTERDVFYASASRLYKSYRTESESESEWSESSAVKEEGFGWRFIMSYCNWLWLRVIVMEWSINSTIQSKPRLLVTPIYTGQYVFYEVRTIILNIIQNREADVEGTLWTGFGICLVRTSVGAVACSHWGFRGFLQSLYGNFGVKPRLGYNCFLKNNFEFMCHPTTQWCIVSIMKMSLKNPQKLKNTTHNQ